MQGLEWPQWDFTRRRPIPSLSVNTRWQSSSFPRLIFSSACGGMVQVFSIYHFSNEHPTP